MKARREAELPDLWDHHAKAWRDPAQVISRSQDSTDIDSRLFEARVHGPWWELLEELGITLFATREYEHFVIAMSAPSGRPTITYLPVPHPSGLVLDRPNKQAFLASTRNPNQLFILRPATGALSRTDFCVPGSITRPLVPVKTAFHPGSLYLHDLAIIGGKLHANAVGHNSVVRLAPSDTFKHVWWPKCINTANGQMFSQNHIQLNSIASGSTVERSYYSASSAKIGRLRPGHLNYKVDRQGVIFSGQTREPICSGLTRPHSARLCDDTIWVANSGYGELGLVSGGKLQVTNRLPGWTRGLCLREDLAFVGTSRVIPAYSRYAPGLDVHKSRCGIHAISIKSGAVLCSIEWPWGNQIFAIDWIDAEISAGFPFAASKRQHHSERSLFYGFLTDK